MDHEQRMRGLAVEEILANPAQVAGPLMLERDAGADASMDEEIVAEAEAVGKTVDKGEVAARDRSADHRGGGGGIELGDVARIDAVALDAFGAAEFEPVAQPLRLRAERAHQHFLVIAHQEYRVERRIIEPSQPRDDPLRIGTTIDHVAEQDEKFARAGPGLAIGRDLFEQCVEQVEPAMHVADRIRARFGWSAGRAGVSRQHSWDLSSRPDSQQPRGSAATRVSSPVVTLRRAERCAADRARCRACHRRACRRARRAGPI